jgi:uncharacterized protein YceH (UPF0502 family)
MTTDPNSASASPAPVEQRWKPLTPNQRRVLGVLIEKAKTTPAIYPMSINAIATGCNQKNNREPLMDLEEGEVERTLDELATLGAASEAPVVSRVVKYRHHAYEWLGVDRAGMAVMTELLLRGEQSIGDLRGRAARMEPIADLAALKPIVDALVQRGLMIELTAPGRGQVVSHNLYREPELEALRAKYAGGAPSHGSGDGGTRETRIYRETTAVADESIARLISEVAELRAEVARLTERVAELESRTTATG